MIELVENFDKYNEYLHTKKEEDEIFFNDDIEEVKLTDEFTEDDIEILCAKHSIWFLGSDESEDLRFEFDGHNFYKQNFANKRLSSGIISNCIVKDCDFSKANMSGFEADNVRFINCKFENMQAVESSFTNCSFENCSIKDKSGDLYRPNFLNSTFKDCQFDIKTFGILRTENEIILEVDSKGNIVYICSARNYCCTKSE